MYYKLAGVCQPLATVISPQLSILNSSVLLYANVISIICSQNYIYKRIKGFLFYENEPAHEISALFASASIEGSGEYARIHKVLMQRKAQTKF